MIGLSNLQRHSELSLQSVARENNAAARAAGWEDSEGSEAEGETMGNMHLGDQHHYPAPVVVSGNQGGGGLGTLATILLGAAIPASGLLGAAGAYLASSLRDRNPNPPPKQVAPEPAPAYGLRLAKPETQE